MTGRVEALRQLEFELKSFSDEFTAVADDNLFVAWFLRAYLTDSDSDAIAGVTGGSRDKSIDGVLLDDKARVAYVLQAKYRAKRFGKAEPRGPVIEFATLAQTICDADSKDFAEFQKSMESAVGERLTEIRQCVQKRNYRLVLIFVTLGSCSKSTEKDAKYAVRRASKNASIEIIDGKRCLLLLRDYLDGAAPPIPTLDVPIESGAGVRVSGVLRRCDTNNKLESWVTSAKGDVIANMFEVGGRRLFARNIRGFLGESTAINDGMIKTIETEPDLFFYYNNGITIVCDRAEEASHKGIDSIRVSNPQVINGQQTSRVLAESPDSKDASVLVKIIQIPRDSMHGMDKFDGLIGKIVQATNWQNAIKPSDLRANDRLQLALEKELRRLDYFYARKRQTKGEIRAQFRGKRYLVVTKEELAQAVAGCELDPTVARSGKDNLFNEQNYPRIFRNHDPNFYLPKLWLFKQVTKGAKGKPQRGYTKWLVLGFLWNSIESQIRGANLAKRFSNACRKQDQRVVKPLLSAVNAVYVQALAYYRANRGRGASEIDISLFFRSKKGRHKEFAAIWSKLPRVKRRKYDLHIKKMRSALLAE